MKYRKVLLLGLITIGLLGGCASTGRDVNDPTNSLVFGYIDMDDAPTSVDSASLRQLGLPSDKSYWGMSVKDGLFYNAYLPPGSFQLDSFSGSGFFSGEHEYNLPRQGNETALRISKPGIYFLGSFKYKKENTGFFRQGKFSFEVMDKPTEAELLQRILDKDSETRKSAWGDKIRARLAQLKS